MDHVGGRLEYTECDVCHGSGYVEREPAQAAVCPECGNEGKDNDNLLITEVFMLDMAVLLPLACGQCGWINVIQLADAEGNPAWNREIGERWLQAWREGKDK